MPDAYENHDAQYIQRLTATCAADGLLVSIGPVPDGKVWTILRASLVASVAETQDYWFSVLAASRYIPITAPVEATTNPAISRFYPCLREGMEIKLFPGERLTAFRDVATAGSTMSINADVIETDLPFYTELEKHANKDRMNRAIQASSLARRSAFSPTAGGPISRGGGGIPRVK